MFYTDSQRTVTRRDSSLILSKGYGRDDLESLPTTRRHSIARLISDSGNSVGLRPRGSVRKEIISMFFESMLDSILESWEVIEQRKNEDVNTELGKTSSEITCTSKRKKAAAKPTKTKKSRSKIELYDSNTQSDLTQLCWWTAPDEKAIIRFRNGNSYEGHISMKCMHGEGRYQWADGTVFLGRFTENEINGKGNIQWKDDTWYEGDFAGNLRHGRGLYVNSRKQCSYAGMWHYGTKHGDGVIYFPGSIQNSYDGQWIYNVRHGFGSREYCQMSGYKGEWNQNSRDGKGLMIWPNHDFYRGEWKNGVMFGYGFYIWGAHCNNSMSPPSLCAYRGFWEKGKRHGKGVLDLGLDLGSYYEGEFKNNKKHGVGKFVTNSGLILEHKHLFIDNNVAVGPMMREEHENEIALDKYAQVAEPFVFDMCGSSIGLAYHVERVIQNIDKQEETRSEKVNEFMEANKMFTSYTTKYEANVDSNLVNFEDLIDFEVSSLSKALKCYKTNLKNIYYQYAIICNKEKIHFTPVLIRLYLWQLYFDCKLHEKGLTLVEIDRVFHENPQWLSRSAHNPFEKIYFWQFQHSLITVANKLYAKRQLPGKKPDTIVASAFRFFMENDVLPGVGRKRGKLVEGYGVFIPLKGLYGLYRSLGEPCTIRTFLCAVRYPLHDLHQPKPPIVNHDYHNLGRNVYIFGDEMNFICETPTEYRENKKLDLKLFNIGNLNSTSIIKIFQQIFPQICDTDKIMDLNIEITFFEFFEAFITCVEESIRLTEEESFLQEKFSGSVNADIPALLRAK